MSYAKYLHGITVAAVLAVVTIHVANAQDKDTLWTKVSVEDRTISLKWDKSHPWDATLMRGAELMAKYFVDGRREVTESLGRGAARNGEQRTLRFTLPESVRANPVGPVCLFVQLPDRRALPIRRANNQNADTVGFRYAAWERQIRQAGDARAAQERVASAERALATSTRAVAGKQASLAERGWSGPASCDQIATPSAVLGPKPFDVVAPADQDDASRRVCVNRVANGYLVNQDFISETLPKLVANYAQARDSDRVRSLLSEVYSSAFAGPAGATPASLLEAITKRLGADNATVKARATQTAQFIGDWAKWIPTLKNDYRPELGSPNDDLGWPSTAAASAFQLFGPELASQLKVEWAMEGVPAGTVRDLESFLGSALDAYSGCVDDAAKQLKTKYDNWDALRSNAPQRAASAREFLVRECRQEVGAFDAMKAEQATLQQQLVREQQVLTSANIPVPLAGRPQDLNFVSCSPDR
jgi:hypothetical protein